MILYKEEAAFVAGSEVYANIANEAIIADFMLDVGGGRALKFLHRSSVGRGAIGDIGDIGDIGGTRGTGSTWSTGSTGSTGGTGGTGKTGQREYSGYRVYAGCRGGRVGYCSIWCCIRSTATACMCALTTICRS